ncbi:MAG: DNA repair protein RecN [Planctomycetota bacterium]
MLTELSIRDLALIEAVDLTLGEGLNVLTGETGAGKTLLVGAIELLLGETPRGGAAQWVRREAKEARVEGRVIVDDPEVLARVAGALAADLPDLAAEWEEGRARGEAELILGRTLAPDGRTRAHVNHHPVTLRALRAVAPAAIEIHGQNEHQRLLDPAEQERLLDAFGRLDEPLARYREARAAWRALVAERERLAAEREARRDRLELARFQRDELAGAELERGEHARLADERGMLRGAGELRNDLGRLAEGLVAADDAVASRLGAARRTLERWRAILPRLAGPLEELEAAAVHVEEVGAALASLLAGVEDDPARLELVEERLAELERLERKYGGGEEGLLATLAAREAEIGALEAEEESLASLDDRLAAARAELESAAETLAKKRRALAPRLAKAVGEALGALGLAQARFALDLAPRDGDDAARFAPGGSERVEFLLAANPGEDPRPLRHVASGGEAARIMLALRTVLSAADRGRTLVFDEIDAGVGGRLGPEVGAHLRRLAAHHQVLCVTHLPGIAARAHHHLRTVKEVRGGRTRTTVEILPADARVAEIADMIAGGAAHATARAEAARLLELPG